MKKVTWSLTLLVLLPLWAGKAPGQSEPSDPGAFDRLSQKVEDLEGKMDRLEKSASSAAAEGVLLDKKSRPGRVYWKDDFFLSTDDKEFWMKVRGNLHFDTKFYGGNSDNPSHFDVRRARIDFQGMWYEYTSFRVQAEFADSPYIRNSWVDFMFSEWLHLRAGQMKPPFSTAWWTTDDNVHFLERGANTPIYPYFDRGWWLWGDLLQKTLTWNAGVFTGAGMELDEKKGDIDDHKDFVGRLFFSPFRNEEGSFLEGLHLCLEGSFGRQSVPTARFERKGYGAAIRDDLFWSWETETTGRGTIDSRNRLGGELHYIEGPFSLSSEYLVVRYGDVNVYADDGTHVINDDGSVVSWSSWISCFLTGEKKQVSNFGWKQPSPLSNFDPVHLSGTGAWEVLARYTRTRTSGSLFRTVSYSGDDYAILSGAENVDEYTLGVSWTWNPLVRWQLNYVHLNGNGMRSGSRDNEDMIGLRLIFKF